MFKGLIGKKIGMTQIFDDAGVAVPVTIIEAGPCYVTQIRRPENDGYSAVQLGYEEVKPKRLTGGELGHLKRSGLNLPPLRFLREFRAKNPDVKEGETVTVEAFTVGERVDVIGTSKGRGFQGGVKRLLQPYLLVPIEAAVVEGYEEEKNRPPSPVTDKRRFISPG